MKDYNDIEKTIASVLNDIRTKGYSTQQPFEIGLVESRMIKYAEANGIILGSEELYMSAKQIQHCLRPSKRMKDLVVSDTELIVFPICRYSMELYYDGECFIYTNGFSKFIVHPNYNVKISRGVYKVVNFITATKIKDPAEFTLPKYKPVKP